MLLPIITTPNPILHTKTKPLTKEEILVKKTQRLIKNMIETMLKADGAGLAATQVGQAVAICVIAKIYTLEKKEDLVLVNPKWKRASLLKEWDVEGCLSVPEIWGKVKRYKKIKIEALNKNGEVIKFKASDILARVIQHEVDHLNGILFIEKAKELQKIEKKEA